jgi:hypothetical protein
MASPQFIHLIEQLIKNARAGKVRWQPATREHTFRIALGEGVVDVRAGSDDYNNYAASYTARLLMRDGHLVDEIEASQFTTGEVELLRDLFHTARASAFELDRLIDGMQDDLEAGRVRDLPPDIPETEDDIPF